MFESPLRSKNSSYMDKYLQNVGEHSSSRLRDSMPSRLNSLNGSPTTPIRSNSFALRDKENSPITSPSKLTVQTKLLFSGSPAKPAGPNSALSHLSPIDQKYHEFLCRVAEIKDWIESVIQESIPSEIELCVGDALRNGVILASVAQKINPQLVPSVFPAGDKLQFKHTQNINAFITLVEHVGVPSLFRFELQDLYNKKDMPQVFETLNIMISTMNKKWPNETPQLKNLSNQKLFTDEEIQKCRRTWPKIRDFKSLQSSPLPSPKKTPVSSVGLIKDFGKYDQPKLASKHEDNLEIKPLQKQIVPSAQYLSSEPKKFISESVSASESQYSSDLKIALDSKYATEAAPLPESRSPTSSARYEVSSFDASLYSRPRPYVSYFRSPKIDTESATRLEYSPVKASSLRYHSPTISRHSTEDTAFFLKRSQDRGKQLNFYNSYDFSSSRYSPRKKVEVSETEMNDASSKIQAICRGVNVRYEMGMRLRLASLYEKEIIWLQCHIRSTLSRSKFNVDNVQMLDDDNYKLLSQIQSMSKGLLMRNSLDKMKLGLVKQQYAVLKLEAYSKGFVVRNFAKKELSDIASIQIPLIKLQSLIKAILVRHKHLTRNAEEEFTNNSVLKIQSKLRSLTVRKQIKIVEAKVLSNRKSIIKFQCISSGVLLREKLHKQMKRLHKYSSTIAQMSAIMKGNQCRKNCSFNDLTADLNGSHILKLQSSIRGILVRYALDLVDDIAEYNNLSEFQAQCKGYMIRKNLQQKGAYFRRNERSVMIIQKHIRMYSQRSAYLDVMNSINPDLKSVKKFAHLLNGLGDIEEIQNQLESHQAILDSENTKKEKLEIDIRQQLDLLTVLRKYNIDNKIVDNFQHLKISSFNYPAHEKLFYLLQVQPSYWSQLYVFEPQFVEDNIYVTFTTQNKRMGDREKIYFVRFVSRILQQNMLEEKDTQHFLSKEAGFWQELLFSFLRREYSDLIGLFLPILNYVNSPDVNFVSDPTVIFYNIHKYEATDVMMAVDDQKTKAVFVENLKSIWKAVEMVADLFSNKIAKIPYEIRLLSFRIFNCSADRNANESLSLQAVSKVLIDTFVLEFLKNYEYYGYKTDFAKALTLKLSVLMQALKIVFEMTTFEGYLEPLNQYAKDIRPFMKQMLYNVIAGFEYDQEAENLIYEDMVSLRPNLEILSEKVTAISTKFYDYVNEFPQEDTFVDILKECSNEKTIPFGGRVNLELNATSYRFLINDDRVRKTYDQAKRAFTYMMQIEEVDTNLYELAVSSVIPEDEPTFNKLLSEFPILNDDPMIKELSAPLYFNLKSGALRRLNELESFGVINSKDNQLQNVLNDIANTIKNPSYLKSNYRNELEITKGTVEEIVQINSQLSKTGNSLRASIKNALQLFRSSRKYSEDHKGAFNNLKGAYKKVSSKHSDKSSGLKFKWTTRQLFERGALKKIENEKLGEQNVKVFGSSGPKFPDINFKISTSDGAKFNIRLSDKRKGPSKRFSEINDTFDFYKLLNTQVGNKVETWKLLNSNVTFNTSQLLQLIATTFFNKQYISN